MSKAAVDLLIDTSTGITLGVLTNIGIGVLAYVDINVFAGVMTAFDFAMSGPLDEFLC